MFIELHILQSFVPSNLNRDDMGQPKDCLFGGVRRARISSQCLKRAVRLNPLFSKYSGIVPSERTRLMVESLTKRLIAAGKSEEESFQHAKEFSRYFSSKKGTLNDSKTGTMLFLSAMELDEIVAELISQKLWDDMKEIKPFASQFARNIKHCGNAPDISMFGRMLADRPETNIDAACQVAHAISTHRVGMEFDFFTAVDDLINEAGMMGVVGFNSACFYRYASVDFDQLLVNLGGDLLLAHKTMEGFLRASVYAIPGGMQNSFAAQNLPSFLMAVSRKDHICWSLANAFEKPVVSNLTHGLIAASINALEVYWNEMNNFYGGASSPIVAVPDGGTPLTVLRDACVNSFDEWVKTVLDELPQE